MKRSRTGEMLTGGSGDVNPQFLSFSATQSSADTTTTTTQTLPIQRLPQSGGGQVLEVLRVYFTNTTVPTLASATEVSKSSVILLSTKNFGTTDITVAEPTVFAWASRQQRGAFTAAGTYGENNTFDSGMDLTDGQGHGLLVATDNIFAQVQSPSNTGAAVTYRVKILYRMKNVGLREYIGIVQGQQ